MTCLVVNCNHWIGFHITNALLANGYQVDGIEEKNGNDHLSMFFGRNSSFSFVDENVGKFYETVIMLDKWQALQYVQMDRLISTGEDVEQIDNIANKVCIHLPILFGEWMPMNERGFYHHEKWIAFDSESLITSGVYVKDFSKGLIQWLKSNTLPEELVIKSTKKQDVEDLNYENTIYIRDNEPIQHNIKKVKEHYQKNKVLY